MAARTSETRTLRAIGNPAERFAEDKLRLLRGVRLAAMLDFTIESETWNALRAGAPTIRDVSAERVRDELVKIFPHLSGCADLICLMPAD